MTTEPRFMTPEEVLHTLRYVLGLNSDELFDPDSIRMNTSIRSLPETYCSLLALVLAGFYFPATRGSTASPPEPAQPAQVLGALVASRAQPDLGAWSWHSPASAECVEEMRQVLATASNVGELCHELSRRVRLTSRDAFAVLDRPCASGSIFLTLKRRLRERGINVDDLAPSTRLPRLPVLGAVIQEAMLIAPCHMPFWDSDAFSRLMTCGGMLALVSLPVFLCAAMPGAAIFAGLLAFAWIRWSGRTVVTYRDLCKTLAGEPIARLNKAAS